MEGQKLLKERVFAKTDTTTIPNNLFANGAINFVKNAQKKRLILAQSASRIHILYDHQLVVFYAQLGLILAPIQYVSNVIQGVMNVQMLEAKTVKLVKAIYFSLVLSAYPNVRKENMQTCQTISAKVATNHV